MNRTLDKTNKVCICQSGRMVTPENEKLFYLLTVLEDMHTKEFTGQLNIKFNKGGVRRIESIPGA